MFSILISHFILDIRATLIADLNRRAGLAGSTTPAVSDMRFTTVIDNMSTMVYTPWGNDEDETDDQSEEGVILPLHPKSPDGLDSPASGE